MRQLVDPAYVPPQPAPAKVTRKAPRAKAAAAAGASATVAQPWLQAGLVQPPVQPVPAQPGAGQHQLPVNGHQSATLDAAELRSQFAAAFESINALFLQLSVASCIFRHARTAAPVRCKLPCTASLPAKR